MQSIPQNLGIVQQLSRWLAAWLIRGSVASSVPVDGFVAIETPENPNFRRITFTFAIIALAAKLARVDGEVSRKEFLAFREMFPLARESEQKVRRLFQVAREEKTAAVHYARQVWRLFPERPELREEVLERLFRIAVADGFLTAAEEAYLREVAAAMHITQECYRKLQKRYTVYYPQDPFRVLNIPRSASDQQIKAQYRRLIREYHPDGLRSYGYSAEEIKLSERHLAVINEAYAKIRHNRSLR